MNTDQSRPGFDSELQMFCEATVEPRPAMLRFYRWLAEQGELEHRVFGPPAGEWAYEADAGAESSRYRKDWSLTGAARGE
jgi:hypothetical protein